VNVAGLLVGALLQVQHLAAELAALHRQQIAIKQHAGAFHANRISPPAVRCCDKRRPACRKHRSARSASRTRSVIRRPPRRIAGAFDGHLLEADARRALAGDVVVADRRQPRWRDARLPSSCDGALRAVGLQQRVVDHAAERDAVVGKDVAVIFEVLANDFRLGVLQQRLQLRQRGGAVELRGRAGIVVRQRQVGRFAMIESKRDTTSSACMALRLVVSVSSAKAGAASSRAIQVSSWASVRMVS